MGNFANTLFSVLLGWVQKAASWLWDVVGQDSADGLMGWVLDHWLALAIGLCVIGVAVDLLVYLVRWQPYRVWRSFFGRKDEEPEEAAEAFVPQEEPIQWLYANGEMMTEAVVEEPPAEEAYYQPEPEPNPTPRVIPARRRRSQALPQEAQQAYHQPYYPPQWYGSTNHPTDGGTQS